MPEVKNCRICGSPRLFFFLSLGPTPLANSFIKPANAQASEEMFPLDVCFCEECCLVQLGFVVPPEKMFSDYIYFSSTSDTIRAHFASLAGEVLEKYAEKGDLVIEAASNDGVLLKNMLGRGVRPLGVEPATNVAEVARKAGVETLNDFFNSRTAEKIVSSHGRASALLAANVLAHIPDLHDFAKGAETLLEDSGVAIIEFPHLADLVRSLEFDTIYHEHLSYFSLKPLMRLFGSHGMQVFRVRKMPVHGGTMRIYVQKKGGPHREDGSVQQALEEEEALGLYSKDSYSDFSKRVQGLRGELVSILSGLKKDGRKIAIYGAPAKGNTLLNYCKIGTGIVDFAVDKSQYKQGLLTPGMRIPVYSPEEIARRKPDYLLILAWNFSEEIMRQQADFRNSGGKFIIPIPAPRII